MKYSLITGCFYPSDIQYENLPVDLIEVLPEEFSAAMSRSPDEVLSVVEGRVVVVPAPIPDPVETAARAVVLERYWRDGSLQASDNLVARHRDELEQGVQTTLTAAQFTALQTYRRELRSWPEADKFPLIDHRPIAPPWLAEQIR